ncbi:DUF2589 domain-containing protein [Saccharophagus degradans]|uniref:DUF2589 domain-containing protein n=2 Tax=Saccharophagus degradans TaxID=86304 RepID=Q21GL7_SACD2|nr:DUF2589 domain-containing protein [Saccharophagus degradans]ABD82162.1 conserved hypothetical protein [Saccharophagus degradans 2-40]MBU2984645.1 DUF2589 domain-containing protein [Saccharophagus degradans]MDO6422348.1 DUF2589 domain-containing protein [Saccharophagus degradans]MDO6608112.1 DUF2589 domain-containing protein [Saccharophagus degradans]WGO99656.1 DUF2589 domain-containing protein [Saccharophagus degradans]
MSVGNEFSGLPMEELIGGPLAASCIAQYNLAQTMVTFINKIGFKDGKTTTLDFDLERPVDNGSGTLSTEVVSVKAPLLGLVPIPALLIESVTIDFSMEVKSSTTSKTSTEASVETEASGGGLFWKGSIKGKVATNRENTRSTDNTAKYNVNVVARQQQPQEGMAKLMDLMASAVDPIKITVGGAS